MSDEKTPVTLEGIAAVLAVVPALLGHASEKDRQSSMSDALGMLSRACVMAGGKAGAAHVDLADMLEPFRCAGEPDHAGALSRLIAENKALKEYEAWAEQAVRLISTSGDISLTVKAGSNLPEAVGVLLEERKNLSTLLEESGFPPGFRGAYTLFARLQDLVVTWLKAQETGAQASSSTLEKQCSDALDEYASFRVMGGEVKTLPQRIRLLGDSWRRMKAAHVEAEKQVSSLLAENEERFRADVAERMEGAAKTMGDTIRDRLLAILFPGQPAPSLDLEGCLRAADVRLNRNKPPLGNPPPYIVRDAALEEAASLIASGYWHSHLGPAETISDACQRIRALKSKPAPVDLHLSAKDEEEILASGGGFSHVSGKTTQSGPAPQPSKNPGEFDPTPRAHLNGCVMDTNHMGPCIAFQPSDTKPEPVQCLVPGCDKPHQHEGPHSESSAPVITEETLRTLRERRETRADIGRQIDALATSDVHDFGWALAQMRAGKKVRRRVWDPKAAWSCVRDEDGGMWGRASVHGLDWVAVLATDWQVVE